MIRFYAMLAACAVALGLAGYGWNLKTRNDALGAAVARLEREAAITAQMIEQAQEARRVADAEAQRQKRKADEYDALRETLLKGGTDEKLPDWFIDYLGRLLGGNSDGAEGAGRTAGVAPAR